MAIASPPVWEIKTLESVGRVIEYWGFKRNHGRVWALLYLFDQQMDATELGERLELSKGAISMIVRELESWGVVRRVHAANRSGVAYMAERNLWLMLQTVLERRESRLVREVCDELREAEAGAAEDTTLSPKERRIMAGHIRNMRRLAQVVDKALQVLIRSRQLDLKPISDILLASLRRR